MPLVKEPKFPALIGRCPGALYSLFLLRIEATRAPRGGQGAAAAEATALGRQTAQRREPQGLSGHQGPGREQRLRLGTAEGAGQRQLRSRFLGETPPFSCKWPWKWMEMPWKWAEFEA